MTQRLETMESSHCFHLTEKIASSRLLWREHDSSGSQLGKWALYHRFVHVGCNLSESYYYLSRRTPY